MSGTNMSASKRSASAILAVVLGVSVVAGVGFTLRSASQDPSPKLAASAVDGTIDINGKTYKKAAITLGVYPGPAEALKYDGVHINKNDWVQYSVSHIVLPKNTYVTFTIHGYDGGETLNNTYFDKVVGTVGNVVNYDGVDQSSVPCDLAVDNGCKVQHTFTIHGLPTRSQKSWFVNVPLLKVEEDDNGFVPTTNAETHNAGHTMTFSVLTPDTGGEYVWNCQFPCGDGTYGKFGAAMSAYGYMSGKVTVA